MALNVEEAARALKDHLEVALQYPSSRSFGSDQRFNRVRMYDRRRVEVTTLTGQRLVFMAQDKEVGPVTNMEPHQDEGLDVAAESARAEAIEINDDAMTTVGEIAVQRGSDVRPSLATLSVLCNINRNIAELVDRQRQGRQRMCASCGIRTPPSGSKFCTACAFPESDEPQMHTRQGDVPSQQIKAQDRESE